MFQIFHILYAKLHNTNIISDYADFISIFHLINSKLTVCAKSFLRFCERSRNDFNISNIFFIFYSLE